MKNTTKVEVVSKRGMKWLNSIDFDKYNATQQKMLMETANKLFPPTREESLMNELMTLLH